MLDADLPDAFERELAAIPGAATARDVLDGFMALAREPIASDEEASVEYDVVRIEVVSAAEHHSIVLKREIAYLESTPDGDANVLSYSMVDVTVPRAPADAARVSRGGAAPRCRKPWPASRGKAPSKRWRSCGAPPA